ncbi:hypothetical protein ACIQ57_22935 [Lysinibacillus xylanilyticus]|uniref:hypothetical protein n=1 Tax=Lysinibacillus xylanilyticus TaxID=582475 RepID=UPI00382DB76D
MKEADCDGFATMRTPLECQENRKFMYLKIQYNYKKEWFVMKINDELLERLGTYFVYHSVYENYGITFENFVERWLRGILEV